MVSCCCSSVLGTLHITCGVIIIATNFVSDHFHHAIFWASFTLIIQGCFSIYGGCSSSLFMHVFISVFSINCIIISCFIIKHTITAWNIDIWDPELYLHWDYLTPQHVYLETQVVAGMVEVLVCVMSVCVSNQAASKVTDKMYPVTRVTVQPVKE